MFAKEIVKHLAEHGVYIPMVGYQFFVGLQTCAKVEKLAAIKKAALMKHLDTKGKVSPIGSHGEKSSELKKAASESLETAELITKVIEAVESAGYEIPGDLPISTFLDAMYPEIGALIRVSSSWRCA